MQDPTPPEFERFGLRVALVPGPAEVVRVADLLRFWMQMRDVLRNDDLVLLEPFVRNGLDDLRIEFGLGRFGRTRPRALDDEDVLARAGGGRLQRRFPNLLAGLEPIPVTPLR